MMDYGLNPDEARELQDELTANEWEALLQVQRQLLDAPMLAPSPDFTNRVLTELELRKRKLAWWRNLIGLCGFTLGTLIVIGLVLWSSPFSLVIHVNGWTELVRGALSLWNFLSTLLLIGRTFTQVLLDQIGSTGLLLFALFALALTVIWTRVVAGNAPLTRSNPV